MGAVGSGSWVSGVAQIEINGGKRSDPRKVDHFGFVALIHTPKNFKFENC